MAHRIGLLKEREPGGYAQVVTERKAACGECNHKKMVCYGCLLNPKIVGRVSNPVNAEAGDFVKMHLSTEKLLLAAAMFYLLPMVTLFVGALTGAYISEHMDVSETLLSICGAIAGLSIGMLFVTALGRFNSISKMFQPVIISIVKPKKGM